MQERGNFAGKYSYNASKTITQHVFIFALLASILWHLFWLFSVKVYITPPAINKGASSNVAFIGAILEEEHIASESKFIENTSNVEINRMKSLAILPRSDNERTGDNVKLAATTDFDMLKEVDIIVSSGSEITGKKGIPQAPFDKVSVSYKAYPSEIIGPIRFREIIYKPDLPTYLRWDEELGVDLDRLGNSFAMEFKFLVSLDGKVKSVERISSSGHPTIDLVGMRYIKGWQFAPLGAARSKEEQWGTVKLNFSLTKAEKR